jgi:hypothetical protein
MCQRDATRCHREVCARAVARPAWLADSLSVDEVFTTTIGASQGGGQARWGTKILTAMAL